MIFTTLILLVDRAQDCRRVFPHECRVESARSFKADRQQMEDPMLTLSEARRIIDGGIAKARELNVDISIAVCDVGGHLIALNRMDNANWNVERRCIGKAAAAAITGAPSEQLARWLMTSGPYGAA